MLRNSYESPGSEADHNFTIDSNDGKVEVVDMKTNYTTKAPEEGVEKINKRDEEMANTALINFEMDFPNIVITNKPLMREIESHIAEAYEENKAAGTALVKKLNSIVAEQLPKVREQEQADFVNEMAKRLEGMTIEDIDKGMAKAHSA